MVRIVQFVQNNFHLFFHYIYKHFTWIQHLYMIIILVQRGPSQGSSRPQVQHHRARQVQTSLTPCPYKKWNLYFPDSGELLVNLVCNSVIA